MRTSFFHTLSRDSTTLHQSREEIVIQHQSPVAALIRPSTCQKTRHELIEGYPYARVEGRAHTPKTSGRAQHRSPSTIPGYAFEIHDEILIDRLVQPSAVALLLRVVTQDTLDHDGITYLSSTLPLSQTLLLYSSHPLLVCL